MTSIFESSFNFSVKITFICLALYSGFVLSDEKKTIFAVFWTGCQEVCVGIKNTLDKLDLNAELVIRDANRDKSKFPGFILEARKMNADLVITYGTTTTLGIVGTLDDVNNDEYLNDIPVVFTLVSDPIRSGIIKSYQKTGRTNVTGTRNRVPESLNIKTMRKIKPSFKRLGILYNQSEKNSVLKVEEIRGLQESLNFELIALELDADKQGKPLIASINKGVDELKIQEVDFIYLGSSTFLKQQMEIFTSAAVEAKLPVLSPYENMVRDSHAYISIAAREHDVGRLVVEQIQKILFEGRIPGDISVISVDQYAYVINMNTAKKINLFPSVDILQIAEIVE